MKPRILAPLDADAIMTKVADRIVKELKRTGLTIAEVEKYQDKNTGFCHISIENNGGSAQNMTDYIKHPNVELLVAEHHDGFYDWSMDIYHKDYDMVILKLVR